MSETRIACRASRVANSPGSLAKVKKILTELKTRPPTRSVAEGKQRYAKATAEPGFSLYTRDINAARVTHRQHNLTLGFEVQRQSSADATSKVSDQMNFILGMLVD
jgi:hypothetical protein